MASRSLPPNAARDSISRGPLYCTPQYPRPLSPPHTLILSLSLIYLFPLQQKQCTSAPRAGALRFPRSDCCVVCSDLAGRPSALLCVWYKRDHPAFADALESEPADINQRPIDELDKKKKRIIITFFLTSD